jgi:GDP-4-dehydro-6-deoxy-D-mannose reductase
VKVLVTGADGFVGRWLVRRLLDDGREVYAAVRPAAPHVPPPAAGDGLTDEARAAVRWLPLELTDEASVRACVDLPYDAVVHLAAVASSAEAGRDPGYAWSVNAAGTARIAQVLGEARRAGRADPVVLLASTGEVYGRGDERPRRETDPVAPVSPYAASKLGAEIALLEEWRRTGLRAVIVRPFAHTGPGQEPRFVVPAFAQRLRFAKRIGAPVVKVGNLEPVREFLHVRDVVDAYARLLTKGQPGEVYNVASGRGVSLETLLGMLADALGTRPIAEADPELMRPTDIPHLVGDGAKLRLATGWTPRHSLEDTLKDVLDAQAD